MLEVGENFVVLNMVQKYLQRYTSNAANIDWDTGIVPDLTDNRLMKEKLVSVLAEAGLTQTQRDPTRGQNLLDLFCCNKPSIVKTCISIPGISDHSTVLADCNLKTPITKKNTKKGLPVV